MATDARIAVGLPKHPKTKKLIKRLGHGAAWNLVCLILWAASDRSDGDLSGMSDEDIELAADWSGEEGAFVAALSEVRFLDGEEGSYVLHDWHEHNPWAAGADMRSEKAKWNALIKHHGRAEAARLMPEYASKHASSKASAPDKHAQTKGEACEQDASSMHAAETSTAPSPSPSLVEAPASQPRKRAARVVPDAFEVTPEMRAWARASFPGVDLQAQTAAFRDHEFKDAKTDWPKAWRNWIRRASGFTQPSRASPAETPYAAHMRQRVEQAAGSLAHVVAAKPSRPAREPWEIAADEQRTIEASPARAAAIGMD